MILCKRRYIFLFIFLFFATIKLVGQDPHFSQFYANHLYLNPAFAGTNNCSRFSLNFRDQWPAIKGDFKTFSGSYDQYIQAIRSGIGVLFSGDIAGGGLLSSYNASAIYNFRARVSSKFILQFALQGGYLTSFINWEKWQYASEIIDGYTPNYLFHDLDDVKKSQFDAAFGFVGYTSYLYFGMAMHHLFPVQLSFLRGNSDKYKTTWEPRWTAHIGGKISISQKNRTEYNYGDIFFYPNIIFISQGTFQYLHEGFYFNIYPVTIGAWLRHNFKNLDAFIISCGVEYKLLRIGYSYDFTLTKLEGTGGAHEVSLQFTIPCDNDYGQGRGKKLNKKKKTNYAPIDCPKF